VAVIFMGQGNGFEENVRHAACSVAVGDGADAVSLADVDMRNHTLSEFVSVMEWAMASRRSVRVSLFLALLLYGLGFCFAAGWNSYPMVMMLAGAASLIAFANTLSGPWPAVQSATRGVVQFPGRMLRIFRLSNRKKA
jgi:cation transport ATPase